MASDAAGQASFRAALSHAKAAVAAGDHRAAFAALRGCTAPEADYVDQARVAKALAAIDLGAIGLRALRVALVAASTMEHLAGVFRFWLAEAGFNADIMITPFDTTIQSVLDPDSTLHRWKPDVVWLFATHRDVVLDVPPDAPTTAIETAIAQAVATRATLWRSLSGCLVIDNTVDIPVDDPFGNLAGAAPWGRRTLLHRYNVALPEAAPSGVMLLDLDHVASLWGKRRWADARYWFHSRHAFALDASGTVAHAAARLLAGARGLAKKCLVLDLDNTLWGGVIGDDGINGIRLGSGADGEAFAAFQVFVRALKERGVILAACSKNDPETATAVFRDHPDSVLRRDDFAVFTANWDNKADNIRDIAATLNIGLDALVFVDDSPAERDIVRRHLPEVAVVELPDDPSGFVAALAAGNWFETIAFSAEDRDRSRYYAENAQRTAVRAAFVDMDDYLQSLEMVATVGGPDPFHLPRMAQLIGKSNQFHLTGTRYTEAELAALAAHPDWFVRRIHLADRFGDNGLIAVLVTHRIDRTLHIDTWVMSCRVLGRTVEGFISNELRKIAQEAGCDRLAGRYVRSAKNALVAGLYDRLDFACADETATVTHWTIDTARPDWKTWVSTAQEETLHA
ncbi:MAG: HAD-IIIC family phosphatase [Acetobacteraceae bacterium]|nr:HAD-IIIC family phosphatase [Acetobacteraceae bacterium]